MALQEVIEEALAHPPVNESTTCEWVIVPLLLELGYSRRDIVSRIADNNGQFPDYTILPDTPHTWFIEAKAWSVTLQDAHAQQSLNYANQNGKRWVALTNGRVWRLYDNWVVGIARDKLVTEFSLDQGPTAEELLRAIGKSAVTSGQLERSALQWRLSAVLGQQLQEEGSEAIRAIWGVLRKQPGLGSVSRTELVRYFTGGVPQRARTPGISHAEGSGNGSHATPTAAGEAVSLRQLADEAPKLATGRNPVALQFPDGSQVRVTNWRELVVQVLVWLGERNQLPTLPFQGGTRGRRYFLNATPEHADGPMVSGAVRKLTFGDRTIYVDTHRSAVDMLGRLRDVCVASGVAASDFQVTMR